MNGKEFAVRLMTTYFTLVTLITAATLIMGLRFDPGASFGYGAFAAPLIYALCGTLPGIVMYSGREMTAKELLIRKIVQFVLIELAVLIAAFGGTSIYRGRTDIMTAMGICIFVIFVLAHGIQWLQDCMLAKRLTRELMAFQENVK